MLKEATASKNQAPASRNYRCLWSQERVLCGVADTGYSILPKFNLKDASFWKYINNYCYAYELLDEHTYVLIGSILGLTLTAALLPLSRSLKFGSFQLSVPVSNISCPVYINYYGIYSNLTISFQGVPFKGKSTWKDS